MSSRKTLTRLAAAAVALVVAALLSLPGGGRRHDNRAGYPTAASLASALLSLRSANALPLYAARAGRTCDNCHSDPTGWANPALKWRKCNLSCMGCHVNPGGGGVRTASGRYYQDATLPMWLSSHRPWKDTRRGIPFISLNERKHRRNYKWDPGLGNPGLGHSRMAYKQSRYNGINADPMFLFGFDARIAFWATGAQSSNDTDAASVLKAFPMQSDIHAMFRPIKHLTASLTAGFLSKSRSYTAAWDRPTPFMVKDAFLMAHQLPLMSYVRVGRFMPIYGTYTDDHTSPIRRFNELDAGQLHSRVAGIEVGLAPNYPYAHASFFRPSQRDIFQGSDPDNDGNPSFLGTGWGAAFAAGWRDLGWQIGVSGMVKRRDLDQGGDFDGAALNFAFNPWYYLDWLPLTYLGELSIGRFSRQVSGSKQGFMAAMHELNALVRNGVNLRIKYDFGDPDLDAKDDHYHRFGFGGDLFFLPGLAFRGEVRWRINPGEGQVNTVDGFFYFRGWY